MTRTALLATGLVALAMLSGCGILLPQVVDPELAQEMSKIPFPKDTPLGEDLDIVATQKGGYLHILNRTARNYDNVHVWLNHQYVAHLRHIKIGPDNHVMLNRFINEHREPFPTGGLLTPDKAYPVVSVELIKPDTGERHRLLARSDDTLRIGL